MPVGSCRDVARLDQSALSRAQDGWRIPKVSQTTIEPFPTPQHALGIRCTKTSTQSSYPLRLEAHPHACVPPHSDGQGYLRLIALQSISLSSATWYRAG